MKDNAFVKMVTVWLISALFSGITVQAQKDKKVNRTMVHLGGQHADAPYGGFVDLKTGDVYQLAEAGKQQERIDLVYAHGQTTGINLMAPSSTGLGLFGARYRDQVRERWDTKNRGTLIAPGNTKALRKQFRAIKTNSELVSTYQEIAKGLPEQDHYDQTTDGPSARIRNLQIGDYVLFRSRAQSRGMYAMGRIVGFEVGSRGELVVDFKVTTE